MILKNFKSEPRSKSNCTEAFLIGTLLFLFVSDYQGLFMPLWPGCGNKMSKNSNMQTLGSWFFQYVTRKKKPSLSCRINLDKFKHHAIINISCTLFDLFWNSAVRELSVPPTQISFWLVT